MLCVRALFDLIQLHSNIMLVAATLSVEIERTEFMLCEANESGSRVLR